MTTISAQKVWPAREGKKFGKVIDVSGAEYMLPVGIQNLFVAGQTYEVATKPAKWGDNVVTVIDGRPQGAPPPTMQYAPQPSLPPAVPQQPAPPAGHNSARMSDPKDMLIFVTGIVGRAMGSGQFGVTDISLLTQAALAAYKANLA